MEESHLQKVLLLYFGMMASCPSRSPPASRCSTGAAAVAASNHSASLNELVAPVQLCSPHLSKPVAAAAPLFFHSKCQGLRPNSFIGC